jgi:hypothetical protein
MSETSTLTGPIAEMLEERDILCFRMQSGRVKVRGGWMKLCPEGTADLLCFPPGRVLWIETKAVEKETHKKQRESQEKFRQKVLSKGHEHMTARAIEDVIAALG